MGRAAAVGDHPYVRETGDGFDFPAPVASARLCRARGVSPTMGGRLCCCRLPGCSAGTVTPIRPVMSPGPLMEGESMAQSYNGYCVKCRDKRDFDGEVTETNGRRMAKGTCPVCGTRMNRILGKG